MEYRYLGSSGLQVSALSLGSWVTFGEQAGEKEAQECMQAAYSAGVNFFDTAEQYAQGEAETILGNVLKKTGWKRSDLVISTKLFWGGKGPNDVGLSRKHILEGMQASLARLQLDYVDLLFCHRPDKYTPIEETVRAMTYLVNQGKALYWGTSEWSAAQIQEAWYIARRVSLIPPQMEQPEYNMLHRERVEREYARLYKEIGLGTTIYSPLASGLLTGKYNKGMPEGSRATLPAHGWFRDELANDETRKIFGKIKQLQLIAEQLNGTVAQLALAWCLKNPHVSTVITGASHPDQVRENMKSLELVDLLTAPIMEQIEQILANKPQEETDFRLE